MPKQETVGTEEVNGRTGSGAVPAAPHPHEAARLRALHALNVLDRAPSECVDRLTALAASVFGVPVAMVTLVDASRQWFLSRCGLDIEETGRDISFCSHALHEDVMMIVEDAREDPRFATNPIVVEEPFVRFYAGVVLRGRDALPLGTLCLISSDPRAFPEDERRMLVQFGELVSSELVHDGASASVHGVRAAA